MALQNPMCAFAGAYRQEKILYEDPSQPLGKFLPQLHSIAVGEATGLRDAHGALMPPCIIMEKGEALDLWIENSGDNIDLFTGLQVLLHLHMHTRLARAAKESIDLAYSYIFLWQCRALQQRGA